jgi:hypothetical protein
MARIAKKWYLNVQMARFTQLQQCMSGETSWKVAFHLKMMASL